MRNRKLVTAASLLVTPWLLLFFVVPVVTMLVNHMRWDDVSRVVGNSSTWRVVWFSSWQAMLSVVATFIIAWPITWLIGRHDFRGRRSLRAMCTVGFLLPSVVVGAAFLAVLPTSLHYTVIAVIIAHAYFNIAVVVRVVGARLELIDPRLSGAARLLGATPTQVLRTVLWPQIRNSTGSAAAVTFLYCFTSFAVVRVLGGPSRNTIESDIALRAFGIGDVSAATVMSVLQVALIAAIVLLLRRLTRGDATPTRAAPLPLAPLQQSQRPLAVVISLGSALFVLTPLAAVLWKSVRVKDGLTLSAWRGVVSSELLRSITASAQTAFLTGVIGAVLAASAAFVLSRSPRIGSALDSASLLPLIVSPVTLGLGLLITFDEGWFDWRDQWLLIVAAHTLVAFPLAARVLVPAWRAIPDRLRDAAATLGSGEVRQVFDVDLRLMRRAITAAFGLTVAVSLGEFGAASLLSRRGTETMPVAIARLLERTGDTFRAQAFAMSSVLIVLCLGALLMIEATTGRSNRATNH